MEYKLGKWKGGAGLLVSGSLFPPLPIQLLPYSTAQTLFRPPAPKEDSVPCSSGPITQLAANNIKTTVAANTIVAPVVRRTIGISMRT